jgi:hypothetical protein
LLQGCRIFEFPYGRSTLRRVTELRGGDATLSGLGAHLLVLQADAEGREHVVAEGIAGDQHLRGQ